MFLDVAASPERGCTPENEVQESWYQGTRKFCCTLLQVFGNGTQNSNKVKTKTYQDNALPTHHDVPGTVHMNEDNMQCGTRVSEDL